MRDSGSDPRDEADLASAALEEAVAVGFRVLRVVMVGLALVFVGSGLFQVDSNETGFVRTFGVLDSTPLEPGIHLSIPVVQEPVRVDRRTRRLTISTLDLKRTNAELQEGTAPTRKGKGLNPKRDGYVLTGDANLLHVRLAASVNVSDPPHLVLVTSTDSLFATPIALGGEQKRDPLLDVLLERAAVHAAAHRSVVSLVGAGKDDYAKEVRQRLQDSLDAVQAGLRVESIDLENDLQPSPQLSEAFAEVGQATQRVDTLRSRAEGDASKISGDGTVAAARLKSRARTEHDQTVARAVADAARFSALRKEWNTQRRTLKERLLAETLVNSVDELGDVFLVPEGDLRIKLERDVRGLDKKLQQEALREQGQ